MRRDGPAMGRTAKQEERRVYSRLRSGPSMRRTDRQRDRDRKGSFVGGVDGTVGIVRVEDGEDG